MATEAASQAVMDFTNVKDGGGNFNKKRQPEGDYKAKVTSVVDAKSKKDGVAQWLFTIQVGAGTYPYYCKHEENQFWKVRNLLVAAGIAVPKKKVRVDPNKIVGKFIAVTLEDDEYDGKAQSNIAATFPLSELSDDDTPDETEDDVEDDEEEEAPPKKTKAKPAPEPEEEEEDEDEDELASLDRSALKALIVKDKLDVAVKKSMSDEDIRVAMRAAKPATAEEDEDEEEDEEPAPPPKKSTKAKAKAKPVDDDDDLEEIDIDET